MYRVDRVFEGQRYIDYYLTKSRTLHRVMWLMARYDTEEYNGEIVGVWKVPFNWKRYWKNSQTL